MKTKRLTAPKFWPVEKKSRKFIVSPRPGHHKKTASIPLAILIRDILKYAQNLKEVKTILHKGLVKVDNKIRKDYAFSVGLMDTVSLGDEYYRIVPSAKGLSLVSIKKEEAGTKLCRIKNKTCLKKDMVQLNLHDGKNILVSKEESRKYKTGDVIVLDTEKNTIRQQLKLGKGATAIIISGRNIGAVGRVDEIVITRSSQPNHVVIDIENRKIPVPETYIFVVGNEAPVISLGEKQ